MSDSIGILVGIFVGVLVGILARHHGERGCHLAIHQRKTVCGCRHDELSMLRLTNITVVDLIARCPSATIACTVGSAAMTRIPTPPTSDPVAHAGDVEPRSRGRRSYGVPHE
jgi:hypothetical protein